MLYGLNQGGCKSCLDGMCVVSNIFWSPGLVSLLTFKKKILIPSKWHLLPDKGLSNIPRLLKSIPVNPESCRTVRIEPSGSQTPPPPHSTYSQEATAQPPPTVPSHGSCALAVEMTWLLTALSLALSCPFLHPSPQSASLRPLPTPHRAENPWVQDKTRWDKAM